MLGPRNTAPGRLRQGPTRTRPEPPPNATSLREALHANLAIKDGAGLANRSHPSRTVHCVMSTVAPKGRMCTTAQSIMDDGNIQ